MLREIIGPKSLVRGCPRCVAVKRNHWSLAVPDAWLLTGIPGPCLAQRVAVEKSLVLVWCNALLLRNPWSLAGATRGCSEKSLVLGRCNAWRFRNPRSFFWSQRMGKYKTKATATATVKAVYKLKQKQKQKHKQCINPSKSNSKVIAMYSNSKTLKTTIYTQ